MEEQAKTCAFTGHRPQRLPFGFDEEDRRCIRIKQALRNQIAHAVEKNGISKFISGMAQGVDLWAAEIVLELKEQYQQILLEAALPCDTQTKNRSDSEVHHIAPRRPPLQVPQAVSWGGIGARTGCSRILHPIPGMSRILPNFLL